MPVEDQFPQTHPIVDTDLQRASTAYITVDC